MRDKLRVLQVGCGARARAHIAAMLACGAVELLALCDLDAERLNAAGDQFGIARRYRDMAEAIRAEQPDLVDIVTPPTIRASIVEPAIEAGARALLIEKPLATTERECLAMLDAVERAGVVAAVAHVLRYRIGSRLLRGLLDEAATARKPLRIHVEKFNPALRLYRRLGFYPIEDKGVYWYMVRSPSAASGRAGERPP